MRAMGSIWTATFSFMGGSELALVRDRARIQVLASNAANRWRGRRRGAISMASKRKFEIGMFGMRHQPGLRGIDDALLLARRHRIGGVIEAGARLDLDEGQQIAPARHDVDLAIGRAKALGQDAIALGHQKGGGAALGGEAGAERGDACGRGELCGGFGGAAPSVFAIVALAARCSLRRVRARGHRSRGAAGPTIRPHAPPHP